MAERIHPLTVEGAIKLWPQIEPLLKPLLAIEGHYLHSDVLAAHIGGAMTVWVSATDAVEAVMVTQLLTYPRKRICHVPWIAGKNLHSWAREFIDKVEQYARATGCQRMTGAYRRGWVRVAGYRDAGSLLYKDL